MHDVAYFDRRCAPACGSCSYLCRQARFRPRRTTFRTCRSCCLTPDRLAAGGEQHGSRQNPFRHARGFLRRREDVIRCFLRRSRIPKRRISSTMRFCIFAVFAIRSSSSFARLARRWIRAASSLLSFAMVRGLRVTRAWDRRDGLVVSATVEAPKSRRAHQRPPIDVRTCHSRTAC